MLTEEWPLEYDPDWPKRWRASDSSRPTVVYLDQWCFDHLARDRVGKPIHQNEAGSYERLRALALQGSVIFPLSQAHYRENWVRTNIDARWDTAVAMAELSGFHTLALSDLSVWDAMQGVQRLLSLETGSRDPEIVGWGLNHCLSGKEASLFIKDLRTGKPARWGSLPREIRSKVAELETAAAYRFELAMLALRDPRLEGVGLPPLAPISDLDGQRFIDQEARIRAIIDDYGRNPKVVRNTIEFLAYRDSAPFLTKALGRLGFPPHALDEMILTGLTPDGRAPAMHDLLSAMPIQGVFTELRVQAHLKEQWSANRSDLLDFLTMATVLPFVDYLVVDRKTFNLAQSGGLVDRYDGRILRRLIDLCESLTQRTATSSG